MMKNKIQNLFNLLRGKAEELSDWTSDIASKPAFIIIHIIWWGCWIGFKVEKFPYGLLTLIVSLEAIVLSGLLLSSGNREGDIEKRIARKDLQISKETNIIVEEIHDIIRDLQDDVKRLNGESED
jgi:uncharacterized membrane protein